MRDLYRSFAAEKRLYAKAVPAKHGLLRSPVLRSLGYLYPRVQIADYLYWALALLWYI